MYLDTSRDILNIVLSIAIIWLTVLLSWILWYILQIARGMRNVVEDIKDKVGVVGDVLHRIREKLESTSTYLGLLVDVVKEGLTWVRERGAKRSAKRK
ncbi:hypothetical protein HY629_00940 [Candidatus Uhrbacteria bacterium]|nr:hypothetical protein [Candidatus Uhrbacteria bacterium]